VRLLTLGRVARNLTAISTTYGDHGYSHGLIFDLIHQPIADGTQFDLEAVLQIVKTRRGNVGILKSFSQLFSEMGPNIEVELFPFFGGADVEDKLIGALMSTFTVASPSRCFTKIASLMSSSWSRSLLHHLYINASTAALLDQMFSIPTSSHQTPAPINTRSPTTIPTSIQGMRRTALFAAVSAVQSAVVIEIQNRLIVHTHYF
jgi:hypothetical protein